MSSRRDELLAKKARLAELKRQRELRQEQLSSSRLSIGGEVSLLGHEALGCFLRYERSLQESFNHLRGSYSSSSVQYFTSSTSRELKDPILRTYDGSSTTFITAILIARWYANVATS